MKSKLMSIGLYLLFICCIAACSRIATTQTEMLEIMREKENIEKKMEMCGYINTKDTAMIVGLTGDSEQTYQYHAALFSKDKAGKYIYKTNIILHSFEQQIYIGKCGPGYLIVCNDANACFFHAIVKSFEGNEDIKEVDIDQVPFVYYLDMTEFEYGYDITYIFFDRNGRELH